ncbi:uncharacterized protein LOC126826811 [Patella vulgata]|uniref:uncharacterized protein LOC126826811 n=1 Tax=Patella vulgata TaxID=6465 RepID=UPI00217FCA82|nr:uncharacterized protein LOC126826811 [Patella vulgata]
MLVCVKVFKILNPDFINLLSRKPSWRRLVLLIEKKTLTLPFKYSIDHIGTHSLAWGAFFKILSCFISGHFYNNTFNIRNSLNIESACNWHYPNNIASSWFNNGLNPIKENSETVTAVVPIGEVLNFYLNVTAVEEMDIFYTVNDALPLKAPFSFRCAKLELFQMSWEYIYIEPFNKIIQIEKDLFKMKLCLSPDGYGTYKFFISQQVFNKKLNTSEIIEFQYPSVVNVLADKSQLYDNIFFTFSTINNGPLEINESTAGYILAETRLFCIIDFIIVVAIERVAFYLALWLSNNYVFTLFALCQFIKPRNAHFTRVLENHSCSVHYEGYTSILEILILLSFPILNLYVTDTTLREYLLYIGLAYFFYWTFLNHELIFTYYEPVSDDNRELEALGGIPPIDEIVKKYDIYISYSDRDFLFVGEEILPILRNRGIRLFFRHCDILPGKPVFYESERAICSSKAFIVVATDNYLNDYSRNNFEFGLVKKSR